MKHQSNLLVISALTVLKFDLDKWLQSLPINGESFTIRDNNEVYICFTGNFINSELLRIARKDIGEVRECGYNSYAEFAIQFARLGYAPKVKFHF